MSRHHHSAAFILAAIRWSRGARKPWGTPTVRRFSAGDAETDLVVVGTSLIPREDAPPWAVLLHGAGFEPVVDAEPVRGFVDWEHEPDEFDRQAEEGLS